jgi:hypothetical protein
MQLEDIANLVGESLAISMNHGFDAKKKGLHFYSTCGFHPVFKEIREIGVNKLIILGRSSNGVIYLVLAESRYQETFLFTKKWMSIPRKSQPKI